LAATVAIAIPASAQVYSANIVGYVNVPVAGNGALNLIANPLKPTNGDYNITNTMVLPSTWNDAYLYKWAGTSWANDIPIWYDGFGWFPDASIALGEAFFLKAPAGAPNTSITFVGEVQTGEVANTLNAGLNFVANKFPLSVPWPGQTVGNDNDYLYEWAGAGWADKIWIYFPGYGWFGDGSAGESVDGPVVDPGVGVLYHNKGAAINWNKTFNP